MVERPAVFGGLLDAAPDAIVVVDGEGRIILANAQVGGAFGYQPDELLGQSLDVLVPGVGQPAPGRRPLVQELIGRRKDGSEFPAEISLSAIESDEGVLVSAAIRDVTERRRAAEVQARLAAITQSSHDAIVGTTVDGVITSWNPGAERLYGYPAEAVLGRHVDLLIPLSRRSQEGEILWRIAQGERQERYQTERLRADGSVVTVSMARSPIVDGSGAIVGVASVAQDLTDRQRAGARFRGLLEAAPDAMVCVDGDGLIALVNAQAERLFGYPRQELIGQPVEVLVPERARHVHPLHRRDYFGDPVPRPMGAGMELAGRRRDGSEFPAEISLSALETDDGILVSATIRDVTERLEAQAERERLRAQAERERIERQMQQSQRLESLGLLAGGVAHDFNNLLAVILNYTAFVEEEIDQALNETGGERWRTAASDVEQIKRAAEAAARLTRQLLAFGRREVVRPRVISLNDVVADVEQMLRRTIGEDVELATSLAPAVAPVMADAGQIEQVLVNLAVNARDAMPSGGVLTIDTANVTVDEAYITDHPGLQPGRYVRLRVSDTGTGMAPEVMARAFEPFFSTKAKGEGSGLGLATVYGIVTQAGGHVLLYSQPGLGTTFTLLFPATHEVAVVGEEVATAHPQTAGGTILLVEDESALLEVTRRMLVRNGFRVLAAASGAEAIAASDGYRGEIDLLLTDVVMPKMLGIEIAQKLLATRPNLRVLFMSGYAQPVLASKGTLEHGMLLLEKPFSEPVLLSKVREAIEGRPG